LNVEDADEENAAGSKKPCCSCCCFMQWLCILQGVLLLAAAAVGSIFIVPMLKNLVDWKMKDSWTITKEEMKNMETEDVDPDYYSFTRTYWIYNLTNPTDVVLGKAPALERMGPFNATVKHELLKYEFNEDETQVSYWSAVTQARVDSGDIHSSGVPFRDLNVCVFDIFIQTVLGVVPIIPTLTMMSNVYNAADGAQGRIYQCGTIQQLMFDNVHPVGLVMNDNGIPVPVHAELSRWHAVPPPWEYSTAMAPMNKTLKTGRHEGTEVTAVPVDYFPAARTVVTDSGISVKDLYGDIADDVKNLQFMPKGIKDTDYYNSYPEEMLTAAKTFWIWPTVMSLKAAFPVKYAETVDIAGGGTKTTGMMFVPDLDNLQKLKSMPGATLPIDRTSAGTFNLQSHMGLSAMATPGRGFATEYATTRQEFNLTDMATMDDLPVFVYHVATGAPILMHLPLSVYTTVRNHDLSKVASYSASLANFGRTIGIENVADWTSDANKIFHAPTFDINIEAGLTDKGVKLFAALDALPDFISLLGLLFVAVGLSLGLISIIIGLIICCWCNKPACCK